jgi:hypothetical protein
MMQSTDETVRPDKGIFSDQQGAGGAEMTIRPDVDMVGDFNTTATGL